MTSLLLANLLGPQPQPSSQGTENGNGHAPVDALFEWTSALNNVGLSAGVSSGEGVPAATRVLMILAMWLGRVEILAALLVFKAVLRRG